MADPVYEQNSEQNFAQLSTPFNILIFFPPPLIVACLVWIWWLLLLFFNVIPIFPLFFKLKSHRSLSPHLTPFCFPPVVAYLSLEFYFSPFLAWILFLILIISPPSVFSLL